MALGFAIKHVLKPCQNFATEWFRVIFMTLSPSDELQDFCKSLTKSVCLVIPNTIRSSLSLSCLFGLISVHKSVLWGFMPDLAVFVWWCRKAFSCSATVRKGETSDFGMTSDCGDVDVLSLQPPVKFGCKIGGY